MSEIKSSFRSTYGLDAAGEKVINVAKADKTVMSDGVNVEYVIQENTVQTYDPTRAYPAGFIVEFNNRIWIAKSVIPAPAGPFSEGKWRATRTDPKWTAVNTGEYQLQVGDYITVDTGTGNNVTLTLPSNAQEGDSIVVKDVGGQVGFVDLLIKTGIQSIYDRGTRLTEIYMTIPYSEFIFVYVNRLWNLYNGSEADLARYVQTGSISRISAGETIIRQYTRQEPITLTFPKNANNGDMIHFVGLENSTIPYYNLVLNSFDSNTSIISAGQTTTTIRRSLSGYFIFNATTKIWNLYDTDLSDRLRTVSSDTILFPGETVSVVGQDNTTVSTINLTLPTNVNPGDKVTVALNYIRTNQTVNIVAGGTDKILADKNLMQFPKRSSYPPAGNWVNVKQLTYNGGTDYPPTATFAYIDMGPIKQWMVVSNVPALERVDPTNDSTRTRLGVIALANQSQANLDHENITVASKELAVTPETLANRTALETRRGIARIATTAQVNLATGSASYADDLIVTPKKLDAKQATESMRGLAEIATQAEANGATDDARIITAKKLSARRATPTLAGIAPVVASGGVAPVKVGDDRDGVGTLIYNKNDYSNIVTPKTLNELKAVEQSAGIVYLATEAEVIAGTDVGAGYPIVVTPGQLHKKTATETRIGFSEIATQAEVEAGTDDFRYVTPLKLASRIAKDNQTGIARFATQTEFNAGTGQLIADPARIKTFLSTSSRTAVTAASGLTQTGNLWTTTTFNILDASESQRGTLKLSTQALTDAGVDDTTAVTPKKLQAKKSTTSTEGIIRIANSAETIAGTSGVLAVCPLNLKQVFQVEKSWEATTTRRGTVKLTEGALTFVGNNTAGSTAALDTYLSEGYAISPYELNKTLANYMPLKAKAVDADKLDGLDSSQFVRKDIAQTIAGAITFNSSATFKGNIIATGIVDSSSWVRGTELKINKSSGASNEGLNLYGSAQTNGLNRPTYGIHFSSSGNAGNGNYGETSAAWNTYFTQSTTTPTTDVRGWIFQRVDGEATTSVASITTLGDATFNRNVDAKGAFNVNGKTAISVGSDANNVLFGNTTNNTYIRTNNANAFYVQDSGSNYQIINQKNMRSILDPVYVNATGDTMTGRLNVTAPTTATISQTAAPVSTVPSAANFGTWTISVTDSAVYNMLPGYVVPVYDKSVETGETLPWISRYDEFKGPGTLSQFGSSATNGVGTYQMWAPRPSANTANHNAQTFHMRHWNPVRNTWDGWGRVFTSNAPPTASDIGAMSNNGSVFDSMRIRDWIQIGNLRMYADPTTKTVRFDWIE